MSWVPPNWQPPGWDQPGWQPGGASSAALVATLSIVTGVAAGLSTGITLGSVLQAKASATATLSTGLAATAEARTSVTAALTTGVSLAASLQTKTSILIASPSALNATLYGSSSAAAALSSGIALSAAPSVKTALTAALATQVALAADLYGRATLVASASIQFLIGGPRYVVKQPRTRNFTVSASMAFRVEKKQPLELLPITFDFSPDLLAGETLTGTPTVAITLSLGTDPTPANIANGAAGIDVTGTKVIVPVQGGLDLCEYDITVTVQTTNALKTLTLVGTLPVRAKFT